MAEIPNLSDFMLAIRYADRLPTDFPAYQFQPFAPSEAAILVERLPPLAEYRPMPHPDSSRGDDHTRFALPLKEGAPVSPGWLRLAEHLKGEGVRHELCTMLDIDPATPMFPAVALVRDMPGYRIGIHPDTARKIATVQVYLAAHDRAPHIGVRFYSKTFMPGTFMEKAAIPYLPGTGYFFRRTDASWHGVNATTEADGERNSLMLIYFDSPKVGFN